MTTVKRHYVIYLTCFVTYLLTFQKWKAFLKSTSGYTATIITAARHASGTYANHVVRKLGEGYLKLIKQ